MYSNTWKKHWLVYKVIVNFYISNLSNILIFKLGRYSDTCTCRFQNYILLKMYFFSLKLIRIEWQVICIQNVLYVVYINICCTLVAHAMYICKCVLKYIHVHLNDFTSIGFFKFQIYHELHQYMFINIKFES